MTTPGSSVNAVALRLSPGQDLLAALDEISEKHELKAACVLTCVGSLTVAVLRFADWKEPAELTGPFEIVSLTGTLSSHGSHCHISISDQQGKTIGGHLLPGCLIYTTAEIVLGVINDQQILRSYDPKTGYDELDILSSYGLAL